jgi:hypothetical protein
MKAQHYFSERLIWVAIAIPIAYAIFLAWTSNAEFPLSMHVASKVPFLADKPVGEDGFYMLTVAWNWAAGNGFAVTPGESTTGVQPLATVWFGLLAKLVQLTGRDKFDFVRVVILSGALSLACFALVMGALTGRIAVMLNHARRERVACTVAVLIVATSFYCFRLFTYGLETGYYLLMLSIAVYASLALVKAQQSFRDSCVVGALFGLCGLARVDFGLVLFFWLLLLVGWRQVTVKACLTMGTIAFLVVLPWLFWVHAVSGSWLPSSGSAQMAAVTLENFPVRSLAMLLALTQNLFPVVFFGGRPLVGVGVLACVVATFCFMLYAARRSQVVVPAVLRAWVLSVSLLPLVYLSMFWSTHFYARYVAPLMVVSLPLLALGLAFGADKLQHIAKRAWFGGAAYFLAILLVVNGFLAFFSLHRGFVGNSHSVSAGFVRHKLPETSKVGAFQSGVIGYFNANVVNLDGKVNTDALRAASQGRFDDYLRESEIRYLVDWRDLLDDVFRKGVVNKADWLPCSDEVPNAASICLRRRDTLELHK